MKVITHQTPNGALKVQLCPAHSADLSVVKKHLGANYGGVYMGLHEGFCSECEHVRGDSADAAISVGDRVEGGDTEEDADEGEVIAVDGDRVTVSWRGSGVRTTQHVSALRRQV